MSAILKLKQLHHIFFSLPPCNRSVGCACKDKIFHNLLYLPTDEKDAKKRLERIRCCDVEYRKCYNDFLLFPRGGIKDDKKYHI